MTALTGLLVFEMIALKPFMREPITYMSMTGGNVTVTQLIDTILDEVDFKRPYKDFDASIGEVVQNNPNLVRDIIAHEVDEDAALMLFEHYCSNKVESLNGYVPTTRDNVDILTALLYDVCDEADKRVDNKD